MEKRKTRTYLKTPDEKADILTPLVSNEIK
jgi:hypothetical protein